MSQTRVTRTPWLRSHVRTSRSEGLQSCASSTMISSNRPAIALPDLNGLIHVADEGHPDAMASEPRENFEIGRIAVLRLVHDDLFEPSCNCSSRSKWIDPCRRRGSPGRHGFGAT